MSGAYNDPKLALNRIYTKRGDKGETRLVGGRRVPKDDARVEAYGSVDELNAFVGLARVSAQEAAREQPQLARLSRILLRVEQELFNLGSLLATDPEDLGPRQPRIGAAEVGRLESEIDEMNAELEALSSFTLPGGCRLNAELHLCRTVCRRAERRVVALNRSAEAAPAALEYLNRLSDAFFVWSRWASARLGAEEVLWDPNKASSGKR